MRALCVVGFVVACEAAPPPIERPVVPPRSFCTAITHADLQAASWATATKLASIGGRDDPASEQLVRAWLYTQPCVVEVEPDRCSDLGGVEIEAIVRAPNPDTREQTQHIVIRLHAASGASITWTRDCPPPVLRRRRIKTFHFD